MVGRFTPEWMAWARQKIADKRPALVASMTPEELARYDAEERRERDAVWRTVEVQNETTQEELERRTLKALGEEGIAYLKSLKADDYSAFDLDALRKQCEVEPIISAKK